MRRVVRESVKEAAAADAPNKMRDLGERLEGKGVRMRMARGGKSQAADVVFEYRPTYDRKGNRGERVKIAAISGHKLGRGFSIEGIQHALGIARAAQREIGRAMDAGDEEMER